MIWNKYHCYWLSPLYFLAFLLFFLLPQSSYAYNNLQEIYPTISTAGSVTDFNFSGTIYGEKTFFDTFPLDVSLLCSRAGGGNIDTDFNGSTLEGCFNNGASPTTDGVYWTVLTTGGSAFTPDYNTGVQFYFKYQRIGGLWYILSFFNSSTRINSFTYSTTTQIARVKGYWNATTTFGVTERLQFNQFSTLLGIESFNEVIATTTGSFDLSFPYLALPTPATGTTTSPFVADTTLFARIYQYDTNYSTDPFTGVFDSRYKTLLVSTTTTITTLTGINIATSTRNLFAYPEYECGISSLTGCFKNALIWSFYPTQEGVEQYYSFINLVQSKAPIGYFFVARDAIQGLNKDGTPNTNITIPYSLKHYIFSPFDLGISGILWFFFLFNFYKRLKFITI